jgi:hypothetical protein
LGDEAGTMEDARWEERVRTPHPRDSPRPKGPPGQGKESRLSPGPI